MASEPGFPVVLVHPQHRAAVVKDFRPGEDVPGEPERFPPIEVHSAAQEEQQRARGYLRHGEQMPKAAEYDEFPKMLHHPAHVAAVLATQGMTIENGRQVSYPIPGVPEKFPARIVHDAAEQGEWEAKGYEAPIAAGAALEFEKAKLAPGKPGDMWPKWVEGVLMQDPDTPVDLTTEYPKYLHFSDTESVMVRTPEEERALLESRGSSRNEPAVPNVPAPATETPAVPVEEAADHAEFLAWRAQRDADRARLDAEAKHEEERTALISLAEESDIKIDKRWGLDRLRHVVMGEEAAA